MNLVINHLNAAREALQRLLHRPFASLLSILVIAIALSLPALAWVLSEQLVRLGQSVRGEAEISVFLQHKVSEEAARSVANKLSQALAAQIKTLKFVARNDALNSLVEKNGLTELKPQLSDNPLPDALIITPQNDSPAAMQALISHLQAIPEVAHVQADSEWIKRLAALLQLTQQAALLLALLLGSALVITIFNTIRLQILTQRQEISVKLLLGATRSYVRRPFLYFGLLQAALGGLLAALLCQLVLQQLAPSLNALAAQYNISLQLGSISLQQLSLILLTACLAGGLGAALSVSQHIHDGLAD